MSDVSWVLFYAAVLLPAVLLATAGATLAWKRRSIPSYVVASGFIVSLISSLAGAVVSSDYTYQYMRTGGVIYTYAGWLWLTHYAGLIGAILGSLGLVWYVVGLKRERL